jgi:magnesium chelatase family protein
MTGRHIKKFCEIDNDSDRLLETAMEKLGLSARAHSRILKIARTIADVDGSEKISADHVAEAIQYRSLDRKVMK